MKGLTKNTAFIFGQISNLIFLNEYTFIGGSALAVQIGHRLSEDLDFCKWKTPQDKKPTVEWKEIERQLIPLGLNKTNLYDFNQVDFFMENGVKISFYGHQLYSSPVIEKAHILGNINAADVTSIGIMKLELILRRSNFRDYYDIFSILKKGISLKDLIYGAGRYSDHKISTKSILSFISNGNNYTKEKDFYTLEPQYNIDHTDIEKYIKGLIKMEYRDQLNMD
jgi:predicted nucleotidyltransferase component of viral defense system